MLTKISTSWKLLIYTLFASILAGWFIYLYFPHYFGLVLLFFYIVPSNSFIPFPHEPAIIYYGKIFGPLATTITATIPTIVACVLDYQVLTPVFNRTRASKIKDTGIYQKTVRYYEKAPFLTNFVAALSPVPFYPIRILSVASGYPMWKYTSAVLAGRIPRYYLLALFGALLNIPNWIIGLFFLSLISTTVYQQISKRRQRKTAVDMVEDIAEELTEESILPMPQETLSSVFDSPDDKVRV